MDYVESMDQTKTSSNSSLSLPNYQHNRYLFIIKALSIYALVLVIIGTLGNCLSIVVLLRRNLRRYVTMRYLIAVSVADTISLYGWNLNNFYKFTISPGQDNLEELSIFHCRAVSFMSFVGLQLSSWCLTAVSVDRCLSLYSMSWKQMCGKPTYAVYHILILTSFCLLLNCHILFKNGYRIDNSSCIKDCVICYQTRTNSKYIFPNWERVHLIVYNLCPFIIMCICNTYIIYISINSSRIKTKSCRSQNQLRQITIMLIAVTFAFMVLTLPACIYFVFFRHNMSHYPRLYRYMIQIILVSIQFTSHAINFFLYCFTATNFRHELCAILQRKDQTYIPQMQLTMRTFRRPKEKDNDGAIVECKKTENNNNINNECILLSQEQEVENKRQIKEHSTDNIEYENSN
ncbi:unnamed protein product [Didymodactylos carnosus]|uniref:G-protein coupled receptors family 1 profile domain-containing protein n=1 Tax=Didymodactylos carnosus TaxID=1234261 RepID=A0A813ZH27_9BILA|nr:unnamed protein product [Didymodactylos carnosus]CAF0898590.1 unnamed protein product [Didymodactylos carnosus]CAF3566872.1 unnamed protein product [Didymodactylos carnosus]CAF3681423.1 unnamed protein product [Didymodactylos carnosus]